MRNFNVKDHTDEKINKASRSTESLCKLSKIFPRATVLTTSYSFVKAHLGYFDVIYDQPGNDSFINKIETGAILYFPCH